MSEEPKIWGADRRVSNLDCIVYIYEAIKRLNLPEDFSMIDMACGNGLIIDTLARVFPKMKATIMDAREYPTWSKMKKSNRKVKLPIQLFIKKEKHNKYDIVMILDTYRMWKPSDPFKVELDGWILKHAKYFLTSGAKWTYPQLPIQGYDLGYGGGNRQDYPLELYKLPAYE